MSAEAEPFRFGAYELLPDRRLLMRGGAVVPLGGRAFDLLLALVEQHDAVVTKEELLRRVWGRQALDTNTLAVHLSALRKALGDGKDGIRYIATVPGRGYKFVATLEAPTGAAGGGDLAEERRLGNLPQTAGRLFGRATELEQLVSAAVAGRLVTLVGPGGVGKTRLALAAGERLKHAFPDGVWWIDLAPVGNEAHVIGTVARVLGLHPGDPSPLPSLVAALKGKQRLLILDNCEHVAATVAELAVALRSVAGVCLVTTSLEPLGIAGEQVERLTPLAVPAPDEADPAQALMAPAVQLFAARAQAAAPDFTVNGDNVTAVVRLCHRLEGIPLALELAAARAALLGAEPVVRRLDERLLELAGSRRDVLPKHQTLRALLDWSHSLLSEPEKVVLRRLAIFVGGCTLEAAEAVVADGAVPDWRVAEHLASLIDKSLVIAERTAEGARYRLLQTTRAYAAERLAESGEAERIAGCHTGYIGGLFERAYAAWEETPDEDWLRHYEPEIENVRAAIAWSFADSVRAPRAAALASSTALYWSLLGLDGEGRRYVDQALALPDQGIAPAAMARLLFRASVMRANFDGLHALPLAERSAELARQIGDELAEAEAHLVVGTIASHLGRHDEGRSKLLASYHVLSDSHRTKMLASVANSLGVMSIMRGEPEEALPWFRRAIEFARMAGYARFEIRVLTNLAEVEFITGATGSAMERARAAIASARKFHHPGLLTLALNNLAGYLLAVQAAEEARPIAVEALALLRDEGGRQFTACLLNCALLGATAGQFGAAANLLGYVDASLARAGGVYEGVGQQVHDQLVGRLRAQLSSAELKTATTMGAGWAEQQAAAFAEICLSVPPQTGRSEGTHYR